MALREIARFVDVYEADLAAAFLESHRIRVTVTERFQTTVDPLMQRALGIRLMAHISDVEKARDLLYRVGRGDFLEPVELEEDRIDPPRLSVPARAFAVVAAWFWPEVSLAVQRGKRWPLRALTVSFWFLMAVFIAMMIHLRMYPRFFLACC